MATVVGASGASGAVGGGAGVRRSAAPGPFGATSAAGGPDGAPTRERRWPRRALLATALVALFVLGSCTGRMTADDATQVQRELDSVSGELATVSLALESMQGERDELSTLVDTQTGDLTTAEEAAEALQEELDELAARVSDLESDLEEATSTVAARDDTIAGMQREADEAAAAAAAAPAPAPAAAPANPAPAPAQPANRYYQNCDAARADGAAPVYAGQPGYGRHLDRDGDGIGCE